MLGLVFMDQRQIEYWQGAPLSGLTPGSYNFTYIPAPASLDPQVWQPDTGTGTFTIRGIIDRRYPFFTLSDYEANDNPVQFSGGTLRMTGGNFPYNVIPTPVTIDQNGAYIDTSTDNGGFSGPVTGAGSLTVSGGGVFTITGTNTNAGPTTINASKLRLGDGGTTGEITGDVINNGGVLEFNRSDSVNFNGSISGNGAVIHAGVGTTTLTVPSTYSGETIASKGTLAAGANNAFGTGPMWILSSGKVQVGDYSISNSMVSVAGTVIGNLHTTATNAKILMESGNVTGGVTLEPSQVLSGLGAIAGLLNFGGGTVIPGSGTLSVGSLSGPGTLVWNEGHLIGVTDRLASNLNGVYVRVPAGVAQGNIGANMTKVGSVEYPIVIPLASDSGMVDISGVANPSWGTPVIHFNIRSTDNGRGVAFVKTRVSYSEFAAGDNAVHFGKYLDGQLAGPGYGSTDLGKLLQSLDTTPTAPGVSNILRSLDVGGAFASMYTAAVKRSLAVSSSMDGHLEEIAASREDEDTFKFGVKMSPPSSMPTLITPSPDPERNWMAWVSRYTSRYAKGGNEAVRIEEYSARAEGGVLGVEKKLGTLRVGIIAAIGGGKVSFQDPQLDVSFDDSHFGGYGSVAVGNFSLDVSGVWGTASNEGTRPVGTQVYRSSFDSTDRQIGAGVSVRLSPRNSNWSVTPVARLKYLDNTQDGFTESGGGIPFKTERMSHSTIISKVGVRSTAGGSLTRDISLGLDGGAYWVHDFNPQSRNLDMSIAGAPIPGTFSVRSRGSEANSVQINLGVQVSFADRTSIRLGGQREIGQDGRENSGVLSMAINF